MPAWIAVVIDVLTAVVFMMHFALTKHLTHAHIGFDPQIMAILSHGTMSATVGLGSIVYWQYYEFKPDLFLLGLGAAVQCVGSMFYSMAISYGPGGPAISLSTLDGCMLAIIYAVQHQKMLNWMETVGICLGIFGVMIIIFPKAICFCVEKNSSEKK